MQPNTHTFYDLNDAERAVLSEADVAQIAVYSQQGITFSGIPEANLANLPAGHQGKASLARDREPVRQNHFFEAALGIIAKHCGLVCVIINLGSEM
ncbi:hypothetical protein MVLG_03173 [Microbotryum lychnidis-dioicae p1A1 Lamole]|uniref:Uncharacterized protein n=1 Tax=Microbotryum lychnidis-dioicae (strain p1A1 Lamole / MvSl-1064) TaxID=683840 RepID=U5H7D9_USTV1|nr:hypothetical protein MVLG_03173 [Microbotryum lychnidis-dioicae p1A1 Lamole]|eukprot:KDE06523.1 hypothetical protein MVLG_03173 [Microbotryum lychnidis-dioicae p1A1 Lamole]